MLADGDDLHVPGHLAERLGDEGAEAEGIIHGVAEQAVPVKAGGAVHGVVQGIHGVGGGDDDGGGGQLADLPADVLDDGEVLVQHLHAGLDEALGGAAAHDDDVGVLHVLVTARADFHFPVEDGGGQVHGEVLGEVGAVGGDEDELIRQALDGEDEGDVRADVTGSADDGDFHVSCSLVMKWSYAAPIPQVKRVPSTAPGSFRRRPPRERVQMYLSGR